MIIQIFLALLATVFIHELGHLGKEIKFTRFFPIPIAQSNHSPFRYGGLIANALTAYIIFLWKPELLFLKLLGLVSWIYVIMYCFWGSFNEEIKWPRWMWPFVVFDDIPNKYWFIFVPAGIALFLLFKGYYLGGLI